MAILLTKEYKQISTISLSYGEIRTYAKYNSQDNINAYTTYDIKTTYYIPTQNYIAFGSGNLTVDGNRKDYGYTTIYKGETTLMEFQRTLQHENDGTSPIKNIETTFNASFGGSGSTNVDIKMPKIARLPVITGLENINDEQNPKIVFTNPAGFYLKAYFYRLSGYEFVRENIKSPYTFELTTDERNQIRQFMKNMQSDSTPAITIEAYSSKDFSESSYIGEVTKSLRVSITNATPTVSLNVVETNQKVIDVYGGNTASTVVKNVSKLKLTSTIGLKKYATLKSRTYTYNSNQTSNAESITIVPTVNKVSVKVIDSRNLSKTADKTLNMVDYTPVTINSFRFYRTSATSSEIRLSADITYFQGTYNKVANTPIIKYKKGANGTLRTLSADDYTLDTTNKKITINNLVLKDTLIYTEQETFYLYVNDIFSSDSENNPVIKGIPTTERGKFDFQTNGDIFLADRKRENKAPLNVSGNVSKNLFNKNTAPSLKGYSSSNAIISGSTGRFTYIPCKPNTTYTIQKIASTRFIVSCSASVPTIGVALTRLVNAHPQTTTTVITNSTAKYLILDYYDGDADEQSIRDSIQIELGSTASEYEEYFEPTLSIRNSNGVFQEVDINKNNYSIPEQKIGTWIDGKDLYRKVITGTTTKSMISASVKIADIPSEYLIKKLDITVTNPIDGATVMGSTWFSDTDYIYTFINGSRELRCKISNTSYTERDIICILEYTKTTD